MTSVDLLPGISAITWARIERASGITGWCLVAIGIAAAILASVLAASWPVVVFWVAFPVGAALAAFHGHTLTPSHFRARAEMRRGYTTLPDLATETVPLVSHIDGSIRQADDGDPQLVAR